MAVWRGSKNRRQFWQFSNFLILFIVLSWSHIFLVTGNPLAKFFGGGSENTLYGPEDKVVVLNVTSIKHTIFNSEKAWFVEFFSSWCGHCVNFAPRWKQFALDLWEWRDVVSVAGIDCANENNTPVCREFEVMGYPTLRLYKPNDPELIEEAESKKGRNKNSTLVLNKGEAVQKTDSMEKLKRNLIDELVKYYPKLLALSKLSGSTEVELWQSNEIHHQALPSFLFLIYENDHSTVGQEVALRLSAIKSIKVYRFSQKNKLYSQLGLEGWPAAGYFIKDGTSGPVVLGHDKNLIDFLYKSATRLAQVPLSQLAADNALIPNIVHDPNSSNQGLSSATVDRVDVVSMDDLLHAVRDSLHKEIGVVSLISGEKYSALRDYLEILQLFPSDSRDVTIFLVKLTEWVSSRDNKQIQGSEFMEKLQLLEDELHPWDNIDISSWDECRGTIPGRRGYTCGLWRLFHILTITGVQKNTNEKILKAIFGYVTAFFGCEECREHFSSMARRDRILTLAPIVTQALWLWKAHNEVNLRLKGTPSEDPGFPKQLYPSKKLCAECAIDGSSNMDEGKVLEYLLRIYSQPKRRRRSEQAGRSDALEGNLVDNVHSPLSSVSVKIMSADLNSVKSQQQQQSSPRLSNMFSNTDIGLLLIVYLSVACLLLLGYVHFKMTGRRRLEPLFLFRKICSRRTRFMV